MSVREVMIKHGIPSESSVKTWCRQYRAHGEEALVNKPRGVKPRHVREQLERERAEAERAERERAQGGQAED